VLLLKKSRYGRIEHIKKSDDLKKEGRMDGIQRSPDDPGELRVPS
jgi:hypothetical protein